MNPTFPGSSFSILADERNVEMEIHRYTMAKETLKLGSNQRGKLLGLQT